MLVLRRSQGQSIHIGDSIKITVLGTGRRPQIGIEAPSEISVHREEIYEKIQDESKCRNQKR